ncbi:TlpA family protein disulfide reductase [Parapedobacter deserti]|uniref:TlpA family protein disulfide reductase n=1 Tax=Parapedobacter deserti TaxID=1912957 RepID=A0ABV7JHU2_9SPHI
MKKISTSTVITLSLCLFMAVLLLSPDAKAWVSRGLMAIGLYKPDLAQNADDTAQPTPSAAAGQPSVFVMDGQGTPIDVANQSDKVVFINFWATWCPPCIAEMPSIDKLYQQFKDDERIVFVMVDVDNQYEKSRQFMLDRKLSLPVHVPSGNIPGDWLGNSIPTTVILDKRGQIAARHEGMADYSRPEVVEFIQKLAAE